MADFSGGPGNDTFDGTAADETINGNGGNDVLAGGGGADTVNGGDGDDILFSQDRDPNAFTFINYRAISTDFGTEVDTLIGGNGDDYIVAGYGDNVDGGAQGSYGNRLYITFQGATSGVSADFRLLQSQGSITIGGGVITNIQNIGYLEGSNYDDLLVPIDTFYPTGANVYGRGGNDHLIATYYTGWSQSGLYGGDGDDVVDARPSGYGASAHGDAGNDTLYTNGGAAFGGDGDDIIYAYGAASGDAGNDTIYILAGSSGQVSGGTGDDVIYVSTTASAPVSGDEGNDTLIGGTGWDVLAGGAGNDTIDGGGQSASGGNSYGGDAAVYSGNIADYSFTQDSGTGVLTVVDLRSGSPEGTDTLTNIEYLKFANGTYSVSSVLAGLPTGVLDFVGTAGADGYYGSEEANTAIGSGGNDTFYGNGGNDVMQGNAGADMLDGGSGDDKLYSGDATGAFNTPDYVYPWTAPTLDTGSEVDTLIGGDGADVLFAGYGDNVDGGANGQYGNGDSLYISFQGAPSGVTVDFRQAAVVVGGGTIIGIENVSWVEGSNFDDDITMKTDSGYSSAPVFGLGGNDRLIAGAYTASLWGGDGNDFLDGRGSVYMRTVDGGAGDDILYTPTNSTASAYGDDGNDTIYAHDAIDGGAGDDTVYIQASLYQGQVHGGTGDDAIYAPQTQGHSAIFGDAGNDKLYGGNGNDVLNGGADNDTIFGGTGSDTLNGDAGDDILWSGSSTAPGSLTGQPDGGIDRDTLNGGAGNDQLYIGYGDNADGGADVDTLSISLLGATSGVTLDTTQMITGASVSLAGGTIVNIERIGDINGSNYDDVITLGDQSGAVVLYGNGGNDTITGTGLADFLYGNDGNDALYGGGGNDELYGGAGNDILDGGSGVNNIYGGVGDDTYYFNSNSDHISENPGEGYDTEYGSIGFALADNVERGILTGTGGFQVFGNGGDNWLIGNSGANDLYGLGGNDRLDGGAGADHLLGGIGDDTYVYDPLDTITENANEGSDTIEVAVSYTLNVANVENVTLTGTGDISATGDSGNNVLTGNAGNNTLDGGAGADTMIGGMGDDIYVVDNAGDVVVESVGGGNDTIKSSVSYVLGAGVDVETSRLIGTANINLTGNADHQILIGNSGNNVIDGGGGGDRMKGAAGDDTYIVRSAADTIIEIAGDGDDTAKAAVSYVLGAGAQVEHLYTLDANATTAIDLTGNDYSHDIQGNAGVNVLTGGSGNDTLSGNGGADTLAGGAGDDIYVVTDASTLIVESVGNGNDTIKAFVSYTLGAGVDVETSRLIGTANIDLTGNVDHQILIGNTGNNTIDGGGGGDRMKGAAGDDMYIVRSSADTIVEIAGEGNDTVKAAVGYTLGAAAQIEHLLALDALATNAIDLTGNDFSHDIQGNAGANVLTAGTGDDVLRGFAGNDTLVGGGGADRFVFDHGTDQDTVGDFTSGSDKLDLSAFGFASFAAVQAATHDVGGSAVIDLGGGDSVTLSGFLTAQLQSGDVILSGGGQAPLPPKASIQISSMIKDDGLGHFLDHAGVTSMSPVDYLL